MTATEAAALIVAVASVVAVVLLVFAVAALVRTLRTLRDTAELLRSDTLPLVVEMREAVADASADLDRAEQLIGTAEAISDRVDSASRIAHAALSTPVIKTVALATGTGRAARRLRGNGR